MKYLFAVPVLLVISACMKIDAVVLKHPETGEIVQCGPYSGLSGNNFAATALIQRGCIEDYKEQGYQRAP